MASQAPGGVAHGWQARPLVATHTGGDSHLRLAFGVWQSLITTTKLGKILLGLTVVDFSLGDTIPFFSNVAPVRPKHGELGSFESLDFVFDISYKYFVFAFLFPVSFLFVSPFFAGLLFCV